MNLDYLKTFNELVKLGTFSAVARKMSLSQPAISFQIQKLEQDLGIRLINRNHRKITLTDAGRRLLEFANSVGSEEISLLKDLERFKDDVSGVLMISSSSTPSEYILPAILGEFLKQHPAVDAHITVQDSETVIKGIKDGNYEIGFCGSVPPQGHGLESFKIASDEIVLVVYPEHPLAKRPQVSFNDLRGSSFIFREPTSGTYQSLEYLLHQQGLSLTDLYQRLTLSSSQAIVSAVQAGAGIAFVSRLTIKEQLAKDSLIVVKLEGLKLLRDFYAIFYSERMASRLTHEFTSFVQQNAVVQCESFESS